MLSLYDFGMEISKIREVVDQIEIKGRANAARITFIFEKCNDLIQAINEASEAMVMANDSSNGQNGKDELHVEFQTNDTIAGEDGEVNGKPDSGTAP